MTKEIEKEIEITKSDAEILLETKLVEAETKLKTIQAENNIKKEQTEREKILQTKLDEITSKFDDLTEKIEQGADEPPKQPKPSTLDTRDKKELKERKAWQYTDDDD